MSEKVGEIKQINNLQRENKRKPISKRLIDRTVVNSKRKKLLT